MSDPEWAVRNKNQGLKSGAAKFQASNFVKVGIQSFATCSRGTLGAALIGFVSFLDGLTVTPT